ncbi:threonylcarbamoyl-AMP synthase, partial [Paenibacillus albiflavus]
MTKHWTIGINQLPAPEQLREALQEAAAMLRAGETVAFPTETVYGLGADATQTEAVRGIYAAKGRPSDNPLIVHIADRSQLDEWISGVVDERIEQLLAQFWPGPLTVILPVQPNKLSPLVTAGLSTVGVRMPDHPIARELIRLAGCPVAAPSANSSGKPSPTRAEHVREDLDGRIGGIVDGGSAGVGLESTVVEWSQGALHILRPGGITAEALRAALRCVEVIAPAAGGESAAEAELAAKTPRAPGMKYRHYAPRGRMWLVDGADTAAVAATMRRELSAAKAKG